MKSFVKFLKSNAYYLIPVVAILLVVLISGDLFARVGGGGGGSSSSGGGGGEGIGLLIWYIWSILPFPLNVIVIVGILILIYMIRRKNKQKTILNQLPTPGQSKKTKGYDQFILHNPEFDEAGFKEKAKSAFIQIQQAWAAKDMSKVRKFISDGMYQRLHTQFIMMDLLKQKNTIEKLTVNHVVIDRIDSDGLFDIIHVAIHASVNDKFVSELYPSLNSGGAEDFVEYWSFIKKRSGKDTDLFNTASCPSCGGALPTEESEVSQCAYCGAVTNTGEYGWVLSEITQADDYVTSSALSVKAANLNEKAMELAQENEDFSIQLIEDKVSNGYLQIETARVAQNPALMRRFVTDSIFDKISAELIGEKYVYNRLYLNDVTLIGTMARTNKNVLMVAVKSSYQRVVPQDKKVKILEPVVTSKTDVVFIERDAQSQAAKGSIYAHQCPSCGGSVRDTLEINCPFCGNALNSGANDWVISDIMSMNQYYEYFSAHSAEIYAPMKPNKMDELYSVRDYAFNNVLIMIAADGIFDSEEMGFAEKMAKKWGYSVSKIQPLLQMAQSGKLVLRMPENSKHRKKIYDLMIKAANIDGNISPEEQNLLNTIKTNYLTDAA